MLELGRGARLHKGPIIVQTRRQHFVARLGLHSIQKDVVSQEHMCCYNKDTRLIVFSLSRVAAA